jgi:hypothetical protein
MERGGIAGPDEVSAHVADEGLQAKEQNKGRTSPRVEDQGEYQQNGILGLNGGCEEVDSVAQNQEGKDEEQAGKDHI